jgi:hypothetical protein
MLLEEETLMFRDEVFATMCFPMHTYMKERVRVISGEEFGTGNTDGYFPRVCEFPKRYGIK